MIDWAGAAGAIAAVFGAPVRYHHHRLGEYIADVLAIRSDEPAPGFDGAGSSLREITYEIQMSDLAPRSWGPVEPGRGDIIYDLGREWRVESIVRRDDVRAWSLTVVDAGEDVSAAA